MAAIAASSGSVSGVTLGVSRAITRPRALLLPLVAKEGLAGDAILKSYTLRHVGLQRKRWLALYAVLLSNYYTLTA